MRRRELLLAGGTAAAAVLAGCIGAAQEPTGSNSSSNSARTISVRGSGSASAEPNIAILQAGIESRGESADAVRTDLATRSGELYDALVAYGIDEDNITTGRFTIRERVDQTRLREDGVEPRSEADLEPYRYYLGTHTLTIEVDDIEAAGDVIDTAIDAGADTIGRVNFTLSDASRQALREAALEQAIENANAEAEFIASQIDAEIVEVKRVSTSGGHVTPFRESVAADSPADAPPTELHPDDITVTATVDVKYVMA